MFCDKLRFLYLLLINCLIDTNLTVMNFRCKGSNLIINLHDLSNSFSLGIMISEDNNKSDGCYNESN